MKWIELLLRVSSILFAFGAGAFWFRASIDKAPIRAREDITKIGGAGCFRLSSGANRGEYHQPKPAQCGSRRAGASRLGAVGCVWLV
jgi:hypothetical protein